ncbi:hypothetical protein [Streptomyces sp. T028]|uniref:hypothetical protein n=1 Tax=Streptomyces sp. T028 TaxID=3394379 RepID=UPI003A8AC9FA
MGVDQLPGQVREFANYLSGLLARLDQGAGWCAVFWQRDPDGMQACLDGREVPPWDVVEAVLQDLAAEYGTPAAAQEADRARSLHAAALAAYDARPGGRAALGDRLDVMLREQRYAAERQAELGRLLAAAATQEDAEAIRLDLAWAHDDHERAVARCAELRYRMAESDRRAGERQHLAGDHAIHRPAPAHGSGPAYANGTGSAYAHGTGGGSAAHGTAGGPAAAAYGADSDAGRPAARQDGDAASARGRSARGSEVTSDQGGAGHGAEVGSAYGGSARGGSARGAEAASAPGGSRRAAEAATGPTAFAYRAEPSAGSRSAADSAAPQRPAPAQAAAPAFDPAPGSAAGFGPASASGFDSTSVFDTASVFDPAPRSAPGYDPAPGPNPTPTPASATAEPSVPVPAPEKGPLPKQRKRRRGSARFAGMAEEEDAAVVVPPAAGPVLSEPAPAARRTLRGARFAGAAERAEREEPQREPLDAEARRETVRAVERLVGLRGEGRSGEAHALLVELAYWPAGRIPLLAAELQRAGLSADWTTLLWEAASLPADRLVEAADALVAVGRTADGEQILRQGVARPAEEIGQAVLRLHTDGRRREARALLDAYVRVRTPEETARSAAPDPQTLIPLLLESARGISEQRHWDLIHALRVAGFTA